MRTTPHNPSTARLPILLFDRPRGFAHANLKLFLEEALPRSQGYSYSLHAIEKPEEALALAAKHPALIWLSPMGAAARGKFKETLAEGEQKPSVCALATWKALRAPGPFWKKSVGADKSPGCVGTYWQSGSGAWVCGVPHPWSVEYAARGLIVRWLRGALALGRGQAELRKFHVVHNPPLERLFAPGLCSPDIETEGFSDIITFFGLGDEHGGASWDWNGEVREAVTRWMRTDRPKVGQNSIGYDIPALQRACGVRACGPLGDTMALRSVYTRQWPYALQHEVSQFFMVEPWKAVFRAGTSDEWAYNAQDSEATYWLADHLHRKLKIPFDAGLRELTLL